MVNIKITRTCGRNHLVTDSASPSDGRTRVQSAVDAAQRGLTVDDICTTTGLHANTVRGHLDVLLAAGSVTREAAETAGRGRPRWLYRAARGNSSPFRFLAEALTAQLARSGGDGVADEAAQRWAQAIPDLPVADSPDAAVAGTVGTLNRLGFNATTSPVGDAIAVTACPYVDLVDDNPVICDIHAALVGRLLEQTGQPVRVTSMDVWARPGVCVARLRRSDLVPTRTITIDEDGPRAAEEGRTP